MNKYKILSSSFRVLRRNKLNTSLMILGVVIGITAITLTFSYGKCAEKQITERVKKLFNPNNILITSGRVEMGSGGLSGNSFANLKIEDIEAIKNEIPGVVGYAVFQSTPERDIIFNNKNISVVVTGSNSEAEYVMRRSVIEGEFFTKAEEKK